MVRISEVAARSGVPATTLRYYDTIGLIEARRETNGYRSYDDTVVERLGFIEAAKALSLPLTEIADLLAVVEDETCTQVREALAPRLADRLREVDEHLTALQRLRNQLAAANQRVATCPDSGTSCRSECALLGDHLPPCPSRFGPVGVSLL